ncbi:ensconsin [Ornithorhynchus anatinus]|uniref:ensconsin n=1 Tax=Ornithorhynchus anatinus TaxID=9258 RepID=UPI0019D441C7|nr:ensconsin [Ornithorhynchus anatinus]
MADGNGGSSLRGLREQMVAAAQAIAEERRNQSGSSPVPVQSSTVKSVTKPVIDGSTLRTEERQRLARERREEREKQNAAKETQILEKEKKAKLQYEKQLEERQRKLKEQKQKEEQRRAAVEEKRKQKLEEEREHYEAVVHRTLERSNRLEQRQKRWSWGGSVTPESDSRPGLSTATPTHPVDLVDKSPSSTEPQASDEDGSSANKHSPSTVNLKQTESVMNKRLSTSSATLQNSPEKSSQKRSASLNRLNNKVPQQSELPPPKISQVEQKARRSQINPLESSVISRLLAPTQASLARSKSAAALSSDGKDPPEFHLCPRSAAASTFQHPLQTQKMPLRSRSIDRLKSTASPVEPSTVDSIQKSEMDKQSPTPIAKRPPSPSLSARRRSPSPANVAKRPPSPSTVKHIQRNRPPSPSVLKQRPPSPTSVYKPVPVQRPPLTPSITKKKSEVESKSKDKGEEVSSQEPGASPTSEKETPAVIAKTKDESSSKTVPGTTSAEEAAKILAEKRRLAREQREREEQERIQKKEEERKIQEEMAKKAIEDKARQEEELSRLEEERRLEDEQQQRKSEEERIREEQERLAELQQQVCSLQISYNKEEKNLDYYYPRFLLLTCNLPRKF